MAGNEAVPIADETMKVEEDHHHHDASGKEEALGTEASMEVGENTSSGSGRPMTHFARPTAQEKLW